MPYEYESLGPLEDNVGQVMSDSTLLDVLWRNVAIVDMRSFRQMAAFESSGDVETTGPGTYEGRNPVAIWDGWVPWATGTTSLHADGWGFGMGGERIRVYVNGALKADVAAATTWAATIDVSTGYTDGQMLYVLIRAEGTRPTAAAYVVGQVYVEPVVFSRAWAAAPTFGHTYTAAKLAQLFNATQWCWDRIGLTPHTARRMQRYINGPFKRPTDQAEPSGTWSHGNYSLGFASVQRSYAADILRVYGTVVNQSSPSLRINVFLNGTNVYTQDMTIGTTALSIPISLDSVAVGSRAWVKITGQVLNEGDRAAWKQSKWTFSYIGTNPASGGYPYTTMPAPFVDGWLPDTDLNARLDQLSSIVNAVHDRIVNTPWVFNRIYAMRSIYDYPGATNTRSRASIRRNGSQVRVRGKGVKALWGPVELPKPTEDRPGYIDYDKHTFPSSADLIDGETMETKTIYPDTLEGLDPLTTFELDGEVQWAGELY